MKIIGSHDNGIAEDNLGCLLKIEKGILGVYAHGNANYQKLNQPKNDKQWNFREVNWKENKPVEITKMNAEGMDWVWKYSHVIEYITDDSNTQRLFINPSKWEINKIKWNNGTMFWQRITLYESIIAGLLVLLLQTIGNIAYNEIIKSDKNPDNTEAKKIIIQKTQNCQQINAPMIDTITSDTTDLNRHQRESLRQGIIK